VSNGRFHENGHIPQLDVLWLCLLCPLRWAQWTPIVSIGHVHCVHWMDTLCPLCPFTKMDTTDKNRKLWMDTMDVDFVHWICSLCPSTCPLDMSNGQILSIVSIVHNSQTYMQFCLLFILSLTFAYHWIPTYNVWESIGWHNLKCPTHIRYAW